MYCDKENMHFCNRKIRAYKATFCLHFINGKDTVRWQLRNKFLKGNLNKIHSISIHRVIFKQYDNNLVFVM